MTTRTMPSAEFEDQASLILAAEDCEPSDFSRLHYFAKSDERLIGKLIAHGPVLLRGSRGSGKSALMIEASRRLSPSISDGTAIGIYVSLRHLELLRAQQDAYERFFCELLLRELRKALIDLDCDIEARPTVTSIQYALSEISYRLKKRIVLFFDDAAHIGREASLAEFFDIFRTISSNAVSCKAAIYPGVTRFGTRFDVYNDATVLDVSRNEVLPEFRTLFADIMSLRYPSLSDERFCGVEERKDAASFLGLAVLGNMRAFVFACNTILEQASGTTIGLSTMTDTLLSLATNHYWPLLEELEPKLGIYGPMIKPARRVAEILFTECGKISGARSVLVHRDITEALAKPLEILEYVGFISKRDASRAMKSGGRGARYAVNLCNLLEYTPGTRLTRELSDRWSKERIDPVELHRSHELMKVEIPTAGDSADLAILNEPIDKLRKSKTYPYGLTDEKITVLQGAEIATVGNLAEASDEDLLKLHYVGPGYVKRFRNVVGQAIWM